MRVTTEEYDALRARTGKGQSDTTQPVTPKPSKYHNKRVTVDGITFDSKQEAARYAELKIMLRAGHIGRLRVHPTFEIAVDGVHICNYVADFAYMIDGNDVVEDVKGVRTAVYTLKKKLIEALYGFKIKEVKRRP